MKIHALAFSLILSSAAALAQDAAKPSPATPVELSAEPLHHLKIDNEYVRAFYVEIPSGQTTLLHHHGTDYVTVALGPAEVDTTAPDGTTKHIVWQEGQLTYVPAGVVHAVTNKAAAPFQAAAIELLQNQGHPVCVKSCDNDPRAKDWPPLPDTAKAIGYGDTFRIIAVDIKPQQTVSLTDPFQHLGVLLSEAKGRLAMPGQPSQDVSHPAREIMFHQPHPEGMTLTNTGTEDMRLVEIQFKPAKP